MAQLAPLNIAPGIYTINTPRGAEGRWKAGNHVRFWRGLVQKIGGWQIISTDGVFRGEARGIIDWQSLMLDKYIGLGTELKLYTWSGGHLEDITPLRASGTLTDPFETTNGSAIVIVTDASHGLFETDFAYFDGADAVGGITIDGEYRVTSVIDSGHYTITHSAPATASTTGGGSVDFEYEIHVGEPTSLIGPGYGAGPYGAGTYGTPRTITEVFLALARTWSMDSWGEDLIANPRGGGIYVWDTSVGGRAVEITGAPASARAIFVSEENRHLVALGAHNGSADDPLLVRWASAEDYEDWTPTQTNTAGDKRLDRGNELYCAVKKTGETIIFTDAAAYSMAFEGPPYQFNFRPLGLNGGIAGPNAAKEKDGLIYWMADKNFYLYDGQIRILDCDVLNHVFDNINWSQRFKVWAGANRKFSEVWWLYPTSGQTECDAYVVYNTQERHWTIGTLERSIFVGDSDTFDYAYGAGTDGKLYSHEAGVDADAQALPWSLDSGDLDIGDGEYLMRVRKMIPDFSRLAGSVALQLNGKKYPHSDETISSAVQTISSSTEFVNPKLRARQISVSLSGNEVGNDFAMGKLRMELLPHGKK
jgi:hypothetical protein